LAKFIGNTEMAKAKQKEPKVWTISVIAESYTEVTREPYEDDSWDRGNTSTSWSVSGLRLLEDGDRGGYRESTQVAFKPEKGKIYHLLYAVYSTGDSFGHDEGHYLEVIGVYKNRKVAEGNEKRLREKKPEKRGLVQLKVEGVTKLHGYCIPWDGYFESLDRLEVLSFVLN
jgi:hypothetical protein